mgnify:CR=1 FL=1
MSRRPALIGLVCLLLGFSAWPVKAALELTLTISESGQAILTGPAQLDVVVGELIPINLMLVNNSSSSVAVKPAPCEPAGFELIGEPQQAPALTSTQAGLFLQDLNPLPHTAILRFEAASRTVEVTLQVAVSQPAKGPLFGATTRGLAYVPGFVDVDGNPWPADATPKAGLIFKGYVPLSEAELAQQIALLEGRRELPISLYLAELTAGWADVEPLQGQFYWQRAEATISLLSEKAGAHWSAATTSGSLSTELRGGALPSLVVLLSAALEVAILTNSKAQRLLREASVTPMAQPPATARA